MTVKRPNRLKKGRDQRGQRKLRLGGYLIITDECLQPSGMIACTTVYQLIDEIREKIKD